MATSIVRADLGRTAIIDADAILAGIRLVAVSRLARAQLAQGSLVELKPGAVLDVPLYWAHPRSAQQTLERLTQCVMAAARAWLTAPEEAPVAPK